MAAKIILASEQSSEKFNDRVLLLLEQQTVNVARSSTEEKPDTYNAVFDCRVLSKAQAALSFTEGKFYLKDMGSSNGTFINNFRVGPAGKESEETKIYSQDIVRFGSQVEKDKSSGGKAKCIVARLRIYLADGTELAERPAQDKFFRTRADIVGPEKTKQVSFAHQEMNLENKVDHLGQMITQKFGKEQEMLKQTVANLEKKLKRKQNENQNLLENITKLTEDELYRVAEIYDLKEALECQSQESSKLADELAVKVKEQIENVKVRDLQCDLEETGKTIKCTKDEIWLLKERIRVGEDKNKQKDIEISRLSISLSDLEETNIAMKERKEDNVTQVQMKTMLKDCWKEIESQKLEIKQLNDLMTKGDEILKEKETEISELKKLVKRDKEEMKLKDGQYVNLKGLMYKENETVQKVQIEMKRLLNIIGEDQEIILRKDKIILKLEKCIEEKDDVLVDLNVKEVSIQETFEENGSLKEMVKKMTIENKTIVDHLNLVIEDLKKTISSNNDEIKDMKISLEKQEEIFKTYESLKAKIGESMLIIEQKSKEIERIQNGVNDQTDIDSRINTLNKENSELKVCLCQKEADIESLEQLMGNKEIIIKEIIAQTEQKTTQLNELKTNHASQIEVFDCGTVEKEKTFSKLKENVELDQIKLSEANLHIVNLKKESQEHSKSKDDEIKNLKFEIIKEKDIIINVKLTQEKEILEKEKEISILNTILNQERNKILAKNKEIGQLRKFNTKENGVSTDTPPARPPRTKSLIVSPHMQNQENLPIQPYHDDDNSDAVTFHDALNNDITAAMSDEEDVLIEDLELDEETDDRQPRRSDINIDVFS